MNPEQKASHIMTSRTSREKPTEPRYSHRKTIDYLSKTVVRILDAAATVFAENSFEGTRIDDIAAKAGVNKATIYYHIGGKEKIYHVVLLKHFTSTADALESALGDCDDPLEGLVGIIRLSAEAFSADDRLPRTVAHEMAGGSVRFTPEISAAYERIYKLTQKFIKQGVEQGRLKDIHPGTIHILIDGTLLVNTINTPFRREQSNVLMQEEMVSNADMAALLEDILRGFIALP